MVKQFLIFFLKKDSKITVRKRKEPFFLELYFGEALLKKDSKIIVPKKRNYIFLELYFLKKDFKIIVRKKKVTTFFF